jgi:hypothetical protein
MQVDRDRKGCKGMGRKVVRQVGSKAARRMVRKAGR